MARSKYLILPDDNFRTRNFRLEVYEDWEEDQENGYLDSCSVLNNIRSLKYFIGIRHDKDLWTFEDYQSKKEYMDSNNIKIGDPKKPHYHFVVKFDNPKYRFTLAKQLGINPRFIIPSFKYRNDLEYLLHLHNDDKYPYPIDEAFGTLIFDLKRFITKNICEEDKSNEILDLILSRDSWLLINFIREINNRGLYSTFRSGWSIYKTVLEEHNLGIY